MTPWHLPYSISMKYVPLVCLALGLSTPLLAWAKQAKDNSNNKTQFGGRIYYDIDAIEGAYNEAERATKSEIRQARIYLKSRIDDDWLGKLSVGFDDAEQNIEIKDAYLSYEGWGFAGISMGKFKEPFGLENSTSSKNITAIERSMATEAFSPGRQYGLSLFTENKHQTAYFGIFKAGEDAENNSDVYALTGRYIFTPLNKSSQLVHLGISATIRELANESYKIKERAEVHNSDKLLVSKKLTEVEYSQVLDLEAAWKMGAFSIQTEWYYQKLLYEQNPQYEQDYSGFYAQVSYFLTEDSRPYKAGHFKTLSPSSSSGAWELTSRYSALNLASKEKGVDAQTFMLGLNYYANKKVRLMLNFIHADFDGPEAPEESKGKAVSFRAQYVF